MCLRVQHLNRIHEETGKRANDVRGHHPNWWHKSVIPAFRRWRRENKEFKVILSCMYSEFKPRLSYMSTCLRKKNHVSKVKSCSFDEIDQNLPHPAALRGTVSRNGIFHKCKCTKRQSCSHWESWNIFMCTHCAYMQSQGCIMFSQRL